MRKRTNQKPIERVSPQNICQIFEKLFFELIFIIPVFTIVAKLIKFEMKIFTEK